MLFRLVGVPTPVCIIKLMSLFIFLLTILSRLVRLVKFNKSLPGEIGISCNKDFAD